MCFKGLVNQIAACCLEHATRYSLWGYQVAEDVGLRPGVRSTRNTSLQHPACAMLLLSIIKIYISWEYSTNNCQCTSWEYSTVDCPFKIGLY